MWPALDICEYYRYVTYLKGSQKDQSVLEHLLSLHSEQEDIDVQSAAFHEAEAISTMPVPRLTTIRHLQSLGEPILNSL